MERWMIAANGDKYNHAAAFEKWGFIDWSQGSDVRKTRYEVGDTVYIYCTKPYQRVMYKAEVVKESMPFDEIVDDEIFWSDKDFYLQRKKGLYARLKLVAKTSCQELSLEELKQHGLKCHPQGPIKVCGELASYMDIFLDTP